MSYEILEKANAEYLSSKKIEADFVFSDPDEVIEDFCLGPHYEMYLKLFIIMCEGLAGLSEIVVKGELEPMEINQYQAGVYLSLFFIVEYPFPEKTPRLCDLKVLKAIAAGENTLENWKEFYRYYDEFIARNEALIDDAALLYKNHLKQAG